MNKRDRSIKKRTNSIDDENSKENYVNLLTNDSYQKEDKRRKISKNIVKKELREISWRGIV